MTTTRPNPVIDSRGNAITLEKELGRGGEGAVFDVAGRPDLVAKIYLKPPTSDHAAKLAAMANLANSDLLRIAAWPTEILRDSSGHTTGFLMPKVGGHKPIFKLYSPKPRLQEFPKADWRFLIHAASNTARAFASVHSSGLVIGDVNHGNLVVANDATVQMIDCDSFQVASGGKTWFCTVGVGTHQPPEMQGRNSYAGVIRTPDFDRFGLAVIIFQLLCMARHPFAGRFLGKGEPPSIEDAIASSKYAYSRDSSRTLMSPPPGSLPISALTPEIQELFEQAFSPTAPKAGRPDAAKWVSALGTLAADVRPCTSNRAHYYRRGLSACPWCAIEAASGATLFPAVFMQNTAGTGIGIAALWQEVGRVAEPPQLSPWPTVPGPANQPSPEAREAGRRSKILRGCGWLSVALALGVALAAASPNAKPLLVPAIGVLAFVIQWHHRTTQPGRFQIRLSEVKKDWEALRVSWTGPQNDRSFADLRASLSNIKASYDGLPGERARRLQKLHERQREKQLEEHLDRFFLAAAKISGVGPAKIATLASHGIDTAGDIVDRKVLAVPGFGDATLAKLKAWKRGHEQSFRFDSQRGVSAADTTLLEQSIVVASGKLEKEMMDGLARLRTLSAAVTNQRRSLQGRLSELTTRYSQALADKSVASQGEGAAIKHMILSGVAVVVALSSANSVKIPSHNTALPSNPTATAGPTAATALQAAKPPTVIPVETSPKTVVRTSTSSNEGPPAAPTVTTLPARTTEAIVERIRLRTAANVRAAADASAAIIRIAPTGTELRVFAKKTGWIQVGDAEPWGWVFSGLVEEVH